MLPPRQRCASVDLVDDTTKKDAIKAMAEAGCSLGELLVRADEVAEDPVLMACVKHEVERQLRRVCDLAKKAAKVKP